MFFCLCVCVSGKLFIYFFFFLNESILSFFPSVVGLITAPLRFQMSTFCVQPKSVRPFFDKRGKSRSNFFFGGGRNVCGVSVALHHHHHHKTLLLYLFIFSRPTPLFFRLFWRRTTIFFSFVFSFD